MQRNVFFSAFVGHATVHCIADCTPDFTILSNERMSMESLNSLRDARPTTKKILIFAYVHKYKTLQNYQIYQSHGSRNNIEMSKNRIL